MYQINGITTNPKQSQTILLPSGGQIYLEIRYIPLQLCWVITEISNGDFEMQNVKIVTSPNLLHQQKNEISFGLFCQCVSNREPTLQTDFSDGSASLFILDADEVAAFAGLLSG
jgi:hypothetical protein